MAVNITVIVDGNPGGRRVEQTRYDITRDTEDEAAIATLAILVAIYGKHLKSAVAHISELLRHFRENENERNPESDSEVTK